MVVAAFSWRLLDASCHFNQQEESGALRSGGPYFNNLGAPAVLTRWLSVLVSTFLHMRHGPTGPTHSCTAPTTQGFGEGTDVCRGHLGDIPVTPTGCRTTGAMGCRLGRVIQLITVAVCLAQAVFIRNL